MAAEKAVAFAEEEEEVRLGRRRSSFLLLLEKPVCVAGFFFPATFVSCRGTCVGTSRQTFYTGCLERNRTTLKSFDGKKQEANKHRFCFSLSVGVVRDGSQSTRERVPCSGWSG